MVSLQTWSLATIARATTSDEEFLNAIISRSEIPYKQASIPKRTGGTRTLHIPSERLLPVQEWILRNVLETVSPHRSSFAYTKGRSVKQCAEQHLGARWLVKMDLSEFFPSIDERSVYYLMLKEFEASKLFAFQLARLITCVPTAAELSRSGRIAPYESQYRRMYVAGYRPQFLGRLPQGAPTSGAVANLITRGLDSGLTQIARAEGLTYTRYADDMFLSSGTDRGRDYAKKLIASVSQVAADAGFQINPAKTRVASKGSRIAVLGLHVDGDSLRLPKTMRKRIDGHLRALVDFGIESHTRHLGYENPDYLLAQIEGLLSYANDVAKGWTRSRIEKFEMFLRSNEMTRRQWKP